MSSIDLLWHSFEPFPCVLLLDTREKSSTPSSPPPQEPVESNEFTTEPHSTQTTQTQSPWLLLRRHSLHLFHQFCHPLQMVGPIFHC